MTAAGRTAAVPARGGVMNDDNEYYRFIFIFHIAANGNGNAECQKPTAQIRDYYWNNIINHNCRGLDGCNKLG